jgi:hypothetical protein
MGGQPFLEKGHILRRLNSKGRNISFRDKIGTGGAILALTIL